MKNKNQTVAKVLVVVLIAAVVITYSISFIGYMF